MEIRAKKSLGQNFLKDENVLNRIINSVEVGNKDLIIEIGPGKGALTKKLKTLNCDVIAFEIDERMKSILESLEDDKTKVIFNDFLKVDISDYVNTNYEKIHVIANIPYYITNLIIRKLIDSPIVIDDITLMVQNEVADRLSSLPGSKSYGALTIFSNLEYDVKKLFVVSKNSFDPVPKVDSAIVRFVRNSDKYKINDINKFTKIVNDSFQTKRKTLKNNLKAYDWNKIIKILEENGFSEMVRAEQLPITIFVEISNVL